MLKLASDARVTSLFGHFFWLPAILDISGLGGKNGSHRNLRDLLSISWLRTSIPLSLRSSSALSAEQLMVWKASSLAAANRGASLENTLPPSVSILIVFINIGYPAYLYGCSSTRVDESYKNMDNRIQQQWDTNISPISCSIRSY